MNDIGASVVIKGSVTAAENLAVAGRVEGDIRLDAGELMLAPGSQVVGDIAVPSVVVLGSVQGSLTATERVEVRAGANVSGSIAAPRLAVADGSQMNCRVEMPIATRQEPAEPTPSSPIGIAV